MRAEGKYILGSANNTLNPGSYFRVEEFAGNHISLGYSASRAFNATNNIPISMLFWGVTLKFK